MSIAKVIEVLAQSPDSWEDAACKAIDEAGESLRNIKSIYIKEFQATVKDNQIDQYRVNAKITFEVEKDSE